MKVSSPVIFIFYVVLLIGSIVSLFTIKSRVVEKNRELQQINSQIAEEKKNILILKTELAYLGSPERISKLQAKHLQLKPVNKEQFEKFEEK
jgi:cell division protein FtsL